MNNNMNKEKTKACLTCEKELPLSSYYKDKRRIDGRNNECKVCAIERAKRNRELRIKRDPQTYEREKEYARKRQRENRKCPEFRRRDILKKREYYKKNKDVINQKYREYLQTERGREITRARSQRRHARKRDLLDTFTIEQWYKCLEYFNHSCAYCGSEESLQQEHFIPVSKGGEYTVSNIIPACESCNYNKRAKDFIEWYKEREYFSVERKEKILKYLGYEEKAQQIVLF